MKKKGYIITMLSIVILALFVLILLNWQNRNINVISEKSIPESENLDLEVAKALNQMEFKGKEHNREEGELDQLYSDAREGEDVWDEIEKLELEVESLDREYWQRREEYFRLRTIQGLSQNGLKIGDKIVIFNLIVETSPVSRSQNLSLIIEREREALEAINDEITTQKNKLKEFRERAGEGGDVWSEIENLRSKIDDLKRGYNHRYERYFQLKMLQQFTVK